MDLYCFGDSITYGECDTERGGWVARLKIECMAGYASGGPDRNVFNLGIGGETTRMMRARFSSELQARIDPAARSLVTLAYGANDAAESDGSPLVPEDEFVDNLAWAIGEARRLGGEPWLLSITPVGPAADGKRSASGRLRTNARVARYNDALEELARRTSVELIDVHAAFAEPDRASLFVADGLHPNAEGHARICAVVAERLLRR